MCVDDCMSVFIPHMISILIINVHSVQVYVLENMCEYMCVVKIFICEFLLVYI